jgi:hypothetical protein
MSDSELGQYFYEVPDNEKNYDSELGAGFYEVNVTKTDDYFFITDDIPKRQWYFYLAGSFFKKELLGNYIDELEKLGHKCSWNWTKVEQGERIPELMATYSKNDLKGVKNADIVVAIINDKDYAYRGTFCELGYALACGKRVYVICEEDQEYKDYSFNGCVFAWHPDIIRVKTWNDFLKILSKL